jgi:hypothetical protein
MICQLLLELPSGLLVFGAFGSGTRNGISVNSRIPVVLTTLYWIFFPGYNPMNIKDFVFVLRLTFSAVLYANIDNDPGHTSNEQKWTDLKRVWFGGCLVVSLVFIVFSIVVRVTDVIPFSAFLNIKILLSALLFQSLWAAVPRFEQGCELTLDLRSGQLHWESWPACPASNPS